MSDADKLDKLLEYACRHDERIDSLDKRFDILEADIKNHLETSSKRINKLELWKSNLTGKITLITGVVAVVISMLWDWIKSRFS